MWTQMTGVSGCACRFSVDHDDPSKRYDAYNTRIEAALLQDGGSPVSLEDQVSEREGGSFVRETMLTFLLDDRSSSCWRYRGATRTA